MSLGGAWVLAGLVYLQCKTSREVSSGIPCWCDRSGVSHCNRIGVSHGLLTFVFSGRTEPAGGRGCGLGFAVRVRVCEKGGVL
jgi:hypothetical protein